MVREAGSAALILIAGSWPSMAEQGPRAAALVCDVDIDDFEPSIRGRVLDARARAAQAPSPASVGELGILLHAYDRFGSAAACYGSARRLAPRAFEWIYYEGVALQMSGDIDRAAAVLDEAVSMRPGHVNARIRLADLRLDQGRLADAEALYRRVLGDRPASSQAHYGLGRVLTARGDAAAIDHYERAVALAPDFASALYALALAHQRRGDRPRADTLIRRYAAVRDHAPPVEDELLERVTAARAGPFEDLATGRRLLDEGRYAEAIEALERAARISPRLLQAHVNLVAAYAATGAAEKAEAAYERAAAISPELPELHYNLGVLRLSQQRDEEALAQFRTALAGNSLYADAHNNLGFLLMRRRHGREAAEHFRAALAADPSHRDSHFNLARLLMEQRAGDEAITHFTRATEREDEKTSLYLYYLADACARLSRLSEAERHAVAARERAKAHGQAELMARIDVDLRRLRSLMESRK